MSILIKKFVAIATVFTCGVMMIGPGVVGVAKAEDMSAEDLQAQITLLLEQLSLLQGQLGEEGGEAVVPAPPVGGVAITGVPAGFTFENNLKLGMSGLEVKYLQVVMNAYPDTQLGVTGVGSAGYETEYFGPLTKAGVAKFQDKYYEETLAPWGLTSGTGFVGSTTRAQLNVLLAGAGETVWEEGEVVVEEGAVASEITNAVDCVVAGFEWYGSACHGVGGTPEEPVEEDVLLPSEILNSTECVTAGHEWYDDACHAVGGEPTVTTGTGLTIDLAEDTPVLATVIVDTGGANAQAYIPFLKLDFTASSDGDVVVNTLKLKRSGIPSLDTDISNIQLYDGDVKLADYSSFSSAVVTFNNSGGLFTVDAGETRTVTVVADIADACAASRNIKFSVEADTDVVTDGAEVNGEFPIVGNYMTVAHVGNNLLATLAVATAGNGSGTEPGTTAQELWKLRLTGANKKIDFKRIKFTMVGTIDADDIQNIELYQGSTKLGETALQLESDKTVVFDFSDTPFEINKIAKDFSLKGDIVGGTDRTYRFSIQSMDDLEVWDKENGVRIKPKSADSWAVEQAAAPTTILKGNLTVSKSLNVSTGNIAADALNQVIATFDFKATGEPIKVTSVYVEVFLVDNDVDTEEVGLDNAKIYVDGAQLGSTKDLTETGLAAQSVEFPMGNSFVIQPGVTKQVEIRTDVKDGSARSFEATDTIRISLDSVNGDAIGGNAVAYTKTISMESTTVGGVAGYTRTVQTGQLSTAVNASVIDWNGTTNPVAVLGAVDVLVASFIATVGSGEAVYIDDVLIIDASGAYTLLQNLKVKINGTEIGTTVATPVTNTTYTFTANPRIEVAASSNVLIEVYADLKSTTNLATTDNIALKEVGATGVNTSADATKTNATALAGQDLVSISGGTLTVALSGSAPESAILVMGASTPVSVAEFVFEETTGAEDMVITTLKVKNNLGTDTNLINYSLYDGTTQVGQTQITSTSGVVTFSNLSVTVPKSSVKTLTVKAQANSYPNASADAENFMRIIVEPTSTYVIAEGASSGPKAVAVTANLDGNVFEVYRTNLTAVKGTISGDGSTGRTRSSNQAVSQIKLTADTAYNAKIRAATAVDDITDAKTVTGSSVGDGAWARTGDAETVDVDTTTPIYGTNVIRMTQDATKAAGDGMKYTFTADADWTDYTYLGFWSRSSQITDDMTFTIHPTTGSDTTATVSYAVVNTWYYTEVTLPTTVGDRVDVNLISLAAATALAGTGDTVDIDNLRLYNDSVVLDVTGNLLNGIPDGETIALKNASGTTKMTGYFSGTNTVGTVTLLADTEISVGASEQVFTAYVSTTGLVLADGSGVVETLNVSVDLGDASTAGDMRWYDGAVGTTSAIAWVSGTTPISFNFGY